MNKNVVVIGGGIAGLSTAKALADLGTAVILLEMEPKPGGHVQKWDRLFPSRRPSYEVIDFLCDGLQERIDIRCGVRVRAIESKSGEFFVYLDNESVIKAKSIVLATGFNLFDATRKEEYGYGIYDNVITSAELEMMLKSGAKITTRDGKSPKRVGFIHCVGSRDEKIGNLHCSKVCCVTGVKQAIELRELLPGCEVFSFYMDLRMYDRNFEELYFEAQQKWQVNFIRGRLSECAEDQDHSLILKTEDTLTGRPLKISVDLLVLLVGIIPNPESRNLACMLGLPEGADGFVVSNDEHFRDNLTNQPGVFLAGSVKGPSSIANTIADARAAALLVHTYLSNEVSFTETAN